MFELFRNGGKKERRYNELKGRRSVKINKDIVSWKIYRVIIFELKSNTTRKKISVLRRKKYYYEYFFPLESTCFSLSLSTTRFSSIYSFRNARITSKISRIFLPAIRLLVKNTWPASFSSYLTYKRIIFISRIKIKYCEHNLKLVNH